MYLHSLGIHPGTAGHTKVHCSREGFAFQLYFLLHPIQQSASTERDVHPALQRRGAHGVAGMSCILGGARYGGEQKKSKLWLREEKRLMRLYLRAR